MINYHRLARWISFILICFAVPAYACEGRFTGGGHFSGGEGSGDYYDGGRISFGLTIHCDGALKEPPEGLSNNLEINWKDADGNKYKFHMLAHIETRACDERDVNHEPPAAPVNYIKGSGLGRVNNEGDFLVVFELLDGGEPGHQADQVRFKIRDPEDMDIVYLETGGELQYLEGGNIQAHYDQPHK